MDEFDTEDYKLIRKSLTDEENFVYIDNSLKFLTKKLYDYYQKKVILIIDEYDTPIEERVNQYYEDIHDTLSMLLSSSLKDNEYLERAVLTGIQRVVKDTGRCAELSIFSGLNNPTVCTVEDHYLCSYFGFTEEETKELLEYYGLKLDDNVRNMYDGYHIGNIDIYNPWSIINYASNRILKPYWINASSNKMIRECIKNINVNNEQKKNYWMNTTRLLLKVS